MNVVGKVGSLITQGVYSVATPFHPFGGAVDVIVVQQQDGTFRSTPWYVRFGKFQGVLKGAEKIVRINVNGDEASFHMYLDNSGEAYFVKEVDDDKGIDSDADAVGSNNNSNGFLPNGHRLDHSISDSGVLKLKRENGVSGAIQRAESEGDRRFYEYQEDQSSLADSVDFSEYSNAYDSLEGENFVDSQGSHPEMVLVVDGHVLTAPISESEQNEENLQLKTPQFHLGPGEEADICEGNEELISGENSWAANYIGQLDAPKADGTPRCDTNGDDSRCDTNGDDSRCDTNGDEITCQLQPEACQHDEQHISQAQEPSGLKEDDLKMQADSEMVGSAIATQKVSKSCLEPLNLSQQGGNVTFQNSAEGSNACFPADNGIKQESFIQHQKEELSTGSTSSNGHGSPNSVLQLPEADNNASGEVEITSGSCSVAIGTEQNNGHVCVLSSNGGIGESQQAPALEDISDKSEVVEPERDTSDKGDQSHSGLGFEISLCAHELKVGMGLEAAAEVFEAHRVSAEDFTCSVPAIIKNQNLIIKFKERYLTWEKAAPIVLGIAAYGLDLPVEPKDTINVEQDYSLKSKDDEPGSSSSGRRWRLWPIPFRKVKTLEHSTSNDSNEDVFLDSESTLVEPSGTQGTSRKQFVRTNVPTNEQIASLNLKDGQNLVTFSFSTRVLGTQQVDAHIYLWKWNARIVISDVDGTITKSDVLGQFMPLVGRDWTQSGVARLFSAIKENGYQLLFLSARAIVQAYLTRNFLLNIKQDGKTLPNGPVVISPDGLFPSLFREVIRRAPHEFKIACLEDIRRLFPPDYNPFYAGFGNRDTDELSYLKIGIPKGKIFIINPKGEVAISRISTKSYTSLHTLVNDMFPPTSLVEQEDYNSWNYWRMPLPDID